MIKIYFDNTLINTDYYKKLEKTGQLFNEKFKLGSTLCETYTFSVDKNQVLSIPQEVKIYNDDVLLKTLFVDNYNEDDFTITFELVDSMIKFNFAYDASSTFIDGKASLLDIFNNICLQANIATDIESFEYDDIEVSWFDNSYTARDYLGFIGEINASYFYITADNKLAMSKVNKATAKTFDFSEIGKYKIGQKHKFSRVVWDNGLNFWEAGDETYETYYINTANVYVLNQETVNSIYNEIADFEFYDFEVDNLPNIDFNVGDIIIFTDGVENYKTIAQFSNISLNGNYWIGGISLKVNITSQEETKIIDTTQRIKAIKNIVDRDSNIITTLITETTRLNDENLGLIEKTNNLERIVSNTEETIEVIQSEIVNGVETLQNSLVRIDINGLNVSTDNSKIATTMSNDAFKIMTKGSEDPLAFFGYDTESNSTKAQMDNLTVTNYLVAGYHRTEKMNVNGEKRTGVFYIGG